MRMEILLGDITKQDVDAIVNAANPSLLGGGGVDGAIHAAAGTGLRDECEAVRASQFPDGLPTGAAVATNAGRLPSRVVIHTVGPRHWEHPDGGVDLLASCHTEALRIASSMGLRSVAFPAISCGVYGWSVTDAAPIAVRSVRQFDVDHVGHGIELVRFVLFSDDAHTAFAAHATR